MIVLDTNVLSEVMKPKPSAQVLLWMAAYPRERLFITTITQAEVLYGVWILPAGKRRAAL
jgi:predicted nucleic acid-binding protein